MNTPPEVIHTLERHGDVKKAPKNGRADARYFAPARRADPLAPAGDERIAFMRITGYKYFATAPRSAFAPAE